jgi:hypothetical protein
MLPTHSLLLVSPSDSDISVMGVMTRSQLTKYPTGTAATSVVIVRIAAVSSVYLYYTCIVALLLYLVDISVMGVVTRSQVTKSPTGTAATSVFIVCWYCCGYRMEVRVSRDILSSLLVLFLHVVTP